MTARQAVSALDGVTHTHVCSYYAVADFVFEGHCACFILEKCAGWNSHLTVCQLMRHTDKHIVV